MSAYRDRPTTCPKCAVELQRRESREVWSCVKCAGMLIGTAELVVELVRIAPELVLESKAGVRGIVTVPRSGYPRLRCPTCSTDMAPVFLGGQEIDRCDADQMFWFDVGEHERLLEVARGQHDDHERGWLSRLYDALFTDRWPGVH